MKDTYPSEGLVEGVQTVCFAIILYNFGPKAANMLQMISFATILNHLLSDGIL